MKAAVLTKYDKKSPTIEIKELDLPTLAADEILVDVSVAGVNPLDNLIAHGAHHTNYHKLWEMNLWGSSNKSAKM